jgi:hypothetical protein
LADVFVGSAVNAVKSYFMVNDGRGKFHDGLSDLVVIQTHRNPSGGYAGGSVQILQNDEGTTFHDVTSSWLPDIGGTLGVVAANDLYFYNIISDDLYRTGNQDLVVHISNGTHYGTIILPRRSRF